ncbi:MAG: 30S ribosomal protein S20 [Planctomycetes bacterium]|nr:30S ribosomal protein S20 [Planctomycetota bacterium]
MAHSLSSKKRIRQNVKRRALNRSRASALKTRIRKCMDTLKTGDVEGTERAYREACRALDREANRNTLHRNAAARRKSRLARRINALKQAAQ